MVIHLVSLLVLEYCGKEILLSPLFSSSSYLHYQKNVLYTAVEGSRFLTGFQVGDHGEDMEIPHLLVANETILLCGASSEILRAIRCVQLCFEVVFRMKVNLGKSKVLPLAQWERWEDFLSWL